MLFKIKLLKISSIDLVYIIHIIILLSSRIFVIANLRDVGRSQSRIFSHCTKHTTCDEVKPIISHEGKLMISSRLHTSILKYLNSKN